jgi:hypothetical protein
MFDPEYYYDIIQGTDEWLDLRSGKVTASVGSTLWVDGKLENGFGAGAMTLLSKIVEERLTGTKREGFGGSKATEFGHINEPNARLHYERETFQSVKEVGFIGLGDWVGSSPDGLVGDIGGVEIKCLPTQHIDVIETGTCKDHKKFVAQCMFNLYVSRREWWDLVYYHPHFPKHLQMKVFRVFPDDILFAKYRKRIKSFVGIAESRIKKHLKV